jgi:uncharacterized membrane-anchored protein YhcB (DUF1043 family)
LTLEIGTVVISLVIIGAVCALGGYATGIAAQRRAGNGKSAVELKTEISEYKESVPEHFQTTAGLLHEMTQQYRSVYERMAAGVQELRDAEQATSQFGSLRAGLLPSINDASEGDDSSTDAADDVTGLADADT